MSSINDVIVIAHSSRSGFFITTELCTNIYTDIVNDAGASGVIVKAMGIGSPNEFKDFINNTDRVVFFTILNNVVTAMIWVDYVGIKRGMIHFVTFKRAYGHDVIISGLAVMQYIFNTTSLACIIGLTPIDNKLAIKFNKRVGFVESGVIPLSHYDESTTVSTDSILTYCTKDTINKAVVNYEYKYMQ